MSKVLKRNINSIKAAKPIGKKRTRYRIEGAKGLLLEVPLKPCAKRGRIVKTWLVQYSIYINGKRKQRMKKLGDTDDMTLGQAIDVAYDVTSAARQGTDKVAEQRGEGGSGFTVKMLADQFLTQHVEKRLKASTITSYRLFLNDYISPALGKKMVDELQKRDVILLAQKIADGRRGGASPRSADIAVSIIGSMFNWAIKMDIAESNPAQRVPKFYVPKQRQRVLNNDEIPIFWSGLDTAPIMQRTASIFRLMLLTGQRAAEIRQTRVEHIEFGCRPVWIIPTENSKNKRQHVVPLAPRATVLWADLVENGVKDGFVFPAGKGGRSPVVSKDGVVRAMTKTRAALELEGLRAHDMRRTVRTRMAALGVPKEISARCLNHIDDFQRGVHDEAYNRHEYFDEKLDAFTKWEAHLGELLGELQSVSEVETDDLLAKIKGMDKEGRSKLMAALKAA